MGSRSSARTMDLSQLVCFWVCRAGVNWYGPPPYSSRASTSGCPSATEWRMQAKAMDLSFHQRLRRSAGLPAYVALFMAMAVPHA